MATLRLFDDDPYLKTFDSKVISCEKCEEGYWIELYSTAFFPEGGGQYPELGTLNGIEVLDVQEKEGGRILHKTAEPFSEGESVKGEINFEKRFDFMQQHSGEHIFSGLAHSHFGATNVGFHLGLSFTTIDLDVPLSESDVDMLESEANEAVYKNIPFLITYPSEEQLKIIPYRSKKELTGKVRIVTIPGYDICACCGTHVSKTGEIGPIKITSFQNYKGGTRLTLLCGKRAEKDYRNKNHDILKCTTSLSVKPNELCEAVERLEKEITERKIYESALRKELFTLRAKEMGEGKYAVSFEENLTPDENRIFSLSLAERFDFALSFTGKNGEWKYAVSSKESDCRDLTKKLNECFNGRGGGKPELCMGGCAGTEKEIRQFLEEYFTE